MVDHTFRNKSKSNARHRGHPVEDDAVQDPDAAEVDRDQHGEDREQDRHVPPDVDRDQGVQALEGDVVGDDRLAYWLEVLG